MEDSRYSRWLALGISRSRKPCHFYTFWTSHARLAFRDEDWVVGQSSRTDAPLTRIRIEMYFQNWSDLLTSHKRTNLSKTEPRLLVGVDSLHTIRPAPINWEQFLSPKNSISNRTSAPSDALHSRPLTLLDENWLASLETLQSKQEVNSRSRCCFASLKRSQGRQELY